MKTKLFQLAKTGKIKHLILEVVGNELHTTWFTTADGVNKPSKPQTTFDKLEGKNIGRANETTPEQQAVLEYEAKLRIKTEEGYVDDLSKIAKSESFDIYQPLPKQFAPSKAISKLKTNPFDGTWFAERKYDGVCLVVHHTGTEKIVYSRRMSSITEIVSVVPVVVSALELIQPGDLILGELICVDANGKEDTTWLKGVTNDRTTVAKSQARYDEALAQGFKFEFHVYDILFSKGVDVSKNPFSDRLKLTEVFGERKFVVLTEELDNEARANGWEGWILRQENATTGYILKGKPSREGAYKRKFTETTEVIVVGAIQGNGKQSNVFNSFKIAQYDDNGNLVSCANTGPGKLGEKGLLALTEELLGKGYVLGDINLKEEDYFVLEIEYQNRLPKNDKGELAFFLPISQRLRHDKPLTECTIEKEDE